MNGLILVDKPQGMTSFGVAARIKRIYGQKRVGHTGTLDPIATGVLPVLLGRSTRLCGMVLEADKRYTAGIRLGITTDSLDITGKVLSVSDKKVTQEEFCAVCESFKGNYMQVPPMYSAISKNGVRLYDLARQGIEVERTPREVTIKELNIISHTADNDYIIDVLCSKGTYIRSLADDIGNKLGCGASLFSLRRTMAADFDISLCTTLEEIEKSPEKYLLDPALAVKHLPCVEISEKQANRFKNGGELDLERIDIEDNAVGCFRVYYCDEFFGIGEINSEKKQLVVKCVIKD